MYLFKLRPTLFASAVVLAAAVAPAAALADGVGRLSLVQGNVSLERGDYPQPVGVALNTPVLGGDTLLTGGASRAEVQFDEGSMVRLAPDSQMRFINFASGSREAQLGIGTADVAVLNGWNGNRPQIDTPSVSVRPDQSGEYRVSVTGSGQTIVTVRAGRADVTSGQGTQSISSGTTLYAQGPAQAPSISTGPAVAYDAFDQFNASRDATIQGWLANANNEPPIYGVADLNNYGQWVNTPNYGQAWQPYNDQNPGWAPYQSGNWSWEPNYGYTWVGNEPWGWAPYHYGSWTYQANYGGWLWVPPASQSYYQQSAYYQQPYYQQPWQSNYTYQPYYYNAANYNAPAWAPALVGFVSLLSGNSGYGYAGYNPGLNPLDLLTSALVGWTPLAPGEAYQPWYGWNQGYGNGWNPSYVNGWNPGYFNAGVPAAYVTNNYYTSNGYARPYGGNVYVTKIYRNVVYNNAVTAVTVQNFKNGSFAHRIVIQKGQFNHLTVLHGPVPIAPTAANLRFAGKPVAHPVALAGAFRQNRFAGHPVPQRVAFTQQQRAVTSLVRHTTPVAHMNALGVTIAKPRVAVIPRANPIRPVTARAPQRPAVSAPNVRSAQARNGGRPVNAANRPVNGPNRPLNAANRPVRPANATIHPATAPRIERPATGNARPVTPARVAPVTRPERLNTTPQRVERAPQAPVVREHPAAPVARPQAPERQPVTTERPLYRAPAAAPVYRAPAAPAYHAPAAPAYRAPAYHAPAAAPAYRAPAYHAPAAAPAYHAPAYHAPVAPAARPQRVQAPPAAHPAVQHPAPAGGEAGGDGKRHAPPGQ